MSVWFFEKPRTICKCCKCGNVILQGQLRIFCFSNALAPQFVPKGKRGDFCICVSCSDKVPVDARQTAYGGEDVTLFSATSCINKGRHISEDLRKGIGIFLVSLATARQYLMDETLIRRWLKEG